METPVLEGKFVRLEPVAEHHLPALETIAAEEAIWKYMVWAPTTPDKLREWFDEGQRQQEAGKMLCWVVIAKDVEGGEKIAGATRFMDINLKDRNVEIGNTWLGAEFRGTKVNTESKYLQICYGFERFGMERIQFKAHAKNLRSQAAIKAIGGVYEGTFRRHMLMLDGTYRDSAWFSIIKPEWPDVKELLERRLNAPAVAK